MRTDMHISLYVSDIEKSIQFYTRLFGKTPDKIKTDYFKFELDNPNLIISFVLNPEKVNPNFGHLGLRLDDPSKFESELRNARKEGIIKEEEINVSCCYALQDKFWLQDPDGYHWEVYTLLKDTEMNDPKYQNSNSSSCCSSAPKKRLTLSELGNKQPSCC